LTSEQRKRVAKNAFHAFLLILIHHETVK
jgi:hypothetical protein